MRANLMRTAAMTIIGATLWTAEASWLFLGVEGLLRSPDLPAWALWLQWWRYLPWLDVKHRPLEAAAFVGSAVIASAPFLLLWRLKQRCRRGDAPERAASSTRGRAAWMPMAEARALFADQRQPWGCVVVGEAHRPDLNTVAGPFFDEKTLKPGETVENRHF